MGFDEVEEGGPLAEDDGFGPLCLALCCEDLDQGFDFAAGIVGVGVDSVGAFAHFDGGRDQGGSVLNFGAAHGTFMLAFDDLFDARSVEGVCAGGDYGLFEMVETNGAGVLAFDADLEHLLEGFDVFGCKGDDFVVLEEVGELV